MSTSTAARLAQRTSSLVNSFVQMIFKILGIVLLMCAALWFVWWLMPDDWAIRYALQYDVDTAQVTIDKQPHDCEFTTAPIGDKHCHYQANVATTNATGEMIGGVVDGKEVYGSPVHGTAVKSVVVTWSKVEE